MNRRIITATFALILLSFPSITLADQSPSAPQIVAVKFHGDWCGSCKKMGPIFSDLQNKLDGTPVLFVQLDLTNNTTTHQAQLMASALGLEKVYVNNPGNRFYSVDISCDKAGCKKADRGYDLEANGRRDPIAHQYLASLNHA
jgi:thiol-disulfide isomerase/thioredoxin